MDEKPEKELPATEEEAVDRGPDTRYEDEDEDAPAYESTYRDGSLQNECW